MFSTLKCVKPFHLLKKLPNRNFYILKVEASALKSFKYKLNKQVLRQVAIYSRPHSDWGKDGNTDHVFFQPIEYKEIDANECFGEDISGPLDAGKLAALMIKFAADTTIRELATSEHKMDTMTFIRAMCSFKEHILQSTCLPTELHILLYDILSDAPGRHMHDLYVHFVKHAKKIFLHLDCLENLENASDLTKPIDCYPQARAIGPRKIIFHAGPTNSGKTYQAMQAFMSVQKGIYVGPLKMLAIEVYQKTNDAGTPCDLITGESRIYASPDELSDHLASTVEMTDTHQEYDVAVIDEIQMMKDENRGWAWTRAFLGVAAKEVHVCGESSAIEIVKTLTESTGDIFELREYERLSKLSVQDEAVESLSNVQEGDCIVCFSLKDIHELVRKLDALGHEVAVIYGALPPGAKISQAQRFNDPDHKYKILVCTDAIGMGINLAIRRIIFYTLVRPTTNANGAVSLQLISSSAARQIGGRAGRYGTTCTEGLVTTFKKSDLPKLKDLMNTPPPTLDKVGILPTPDQIEQFGWHLRSNDMAYLIDLFCKMCTVDSSNYFFCRMKDFHFLAKLIGHIDLDLRDKYQFCTAPINTAKPFLCSILIDFASQFSKGIQIDYSYMQKKLNWPFTMPTKISELTHLEEVHDVFELYCWLSYHFKDLFPDRENLTLAQEQLDILIQNGLEKMSQLEGNGNKYGVNNEKLDVGDLIPVFISESLGKIEGKLDVNTGSANKLRRMSVVKNAFPKKKSPSVKATRVSATNFLKCKSTLDGIASSENICPPSDDSQPTKESSKMNTPNKKGRNSLDILTKLPVFKKLPVQVVDLLKTTQADESMPHSAKLSAPDYNKNQKSLPTVSQHSVTCSSPSTFRKTTQADESVSHSAELSAPDYSKNKKPLPTVSQRSVTCASPSISRKTTQADESMSHSAELSDPHYSRNKKPLPTVSQHSVTCPPPSIFRTEQINPNKAAAKSFVSVEEIEKPKRKRLVIQIPHRRIYEKS